MTAFIPPPQQIIFKIWIKFISAVCYNKLYHLLPTCTIMNLFSSWINIKAHLATNISCWQWNKSKCVRIRNRKIWYWRWSLPWKIILRRPNFKNRVLVIISKVHKLKLQFMCMGELLNIIQSPITQYLYMTKGSTILRSQSIVLSL
jgi:hypothetical protein